ncbi:MAG: O-antigen ligase family protein [Agathobacter sp.]|nr:O-antigen ligase family protein [Agathobacter sp.]
MLNNLLLIILVMQPFLDILAYFQEGTTVSIAGYVRLAITVLVPLYVLVKTRSKRLFGLLCVIAGFAALHILNGFRVGYISLFADVKYMLLVAHMPILVLSFVHLYEKEEIKRQILTAFKINAVVLVVTFLISYVLKIGNYTYPVYQQGWTGWAQIPNAQSIIWVVLLPFIVYMIMNQEKKYHWLWMVLLVFIFIVNGTKTSYYSIHLVSLGYIVFLVFEYIIKKKKKFPGFHVVMLVAVMLIAAYGYQYSPRVVVDYLDNKAQQEEEAILEQLESKDTSKEKKIETRTVEKTEEKKDETLEEFYTRHLDSKMVQKFGFERVLAVYGENVTPEELLDMRLKKRVYAKLVWEDSDWMTKLVGFEYTNMEYEGEVFDLENDPPAILYYYGYLGVVLYIVFLGYFVLRIVMEVLRDLKQSLTLLNFALIETLLLQAVMSVYAGYLLRRPNVSAYVMATLLLVYCNTRRIREAR